MSEAINRIQAKLDRKIKYMTRLAEFFECESLQENLDQEKSEIDQIDPSFGSEKKLFFLKCKNNKLRFIKKKYENHLYNDFSSVTAFQLKSQLKGMPTIGLYREIFAPNQGKEPGTPTSPLKDPSIKKSLLNKSKDFIDIQNINLPVFEFKLQSLVEKAFERLGEISISLEIPRNILLNFIQNCLIVYNHVSYHNFAHGFSVFQVFSYYFQQSPLLNQIFSKDEIFVGLIACLSHDLGHRRDN